MGAFSGILMCIGDPVVNPKGDIFYHYVAFEKA